MKNAIFPLIRLGLDNSLLEDVNLSNYIMMSNSHWSELGNLARKQGVLGIVLDGIDKLETTRYGLTRDLNAAQKLEWIGEVLRIEQRNRQQMAVMEEMAGKWSEKDCRVMVMKGQANALFYPNPLHRNPGDIDCYLFNDNLNFDLAYRIGNEVAREVGAKVDESWYKHSVISYKGETFENHLYFVHTREGRRSKELQRELSEALRVEKWDRFPNSQVLLPPVQWNAMFLTYHACTHFLTEGLRLKQVLDWAMFLKKHQNDVDWKAFYTFCERYHLKIFADVMTSICCEHLGISITNPLIETKSTFTEKMVKSILYDDDFIYSENEGGWKEKWHVVRNLFRYRWKYEEIYEECILKQLWYYASGYILKTEK